MKRQLVYIAGAYRSKWGVIGRIINIIKARVAAVKLTRQGYCCFTPHLNWGLMDGHREADFFLKCGLKVLRHCDMIFMLKGWEKSSGSRAELNEAIKRKMKIMYEDGIDPDLAVAEFATTNSLPIGDRVIIDTEAPAPVENTQQEG